MTALATLSLAEKLAALPPDKREQVLRSLSDKDLQALRWDWRFWARPKQLPPAGDWSVCVFRAGRATGKTRSGSGWVHERALQQRRWIALVARTPADARDYMIEGPGGILRNTAPRQRPNYEPSKRRLTWPNGSWATIFSNEEPDQLRGFSGDTAWIDELCKFTNATESWDNLMFGMREASNDRPRTLITTTPRPLAILKRIEAAPGTVVITGTSYENRNNLDPKWFSDVLARYHGWVAKRFTPRSSTTYQGRCGRGPCSTRHRWTSTRRSPNHKSSDAATGATPPQVTTMSDWRWWRHERPVENPPAQP
jgi:phage terminase large subunit-like protein